jgi:hypothetical protein
MSWAKRNLYFLISCVLAVGLLGAAGWYCYSSWQSNNSSWEKLNQDIDELTQLGNQKDDKVDNIKTAGEQAREARGRAEALRKFFLPVPSIPNTNRIDDRGLARAVRDSITQMRVTAAQNNVMLPQDFTFSFSAQREKAVYAASSAEQLAKQLGEIKVLCDTLFSNRVISIESLQRERTSDDAAAATGDYLDVMSVTNNNIIVTPYQATFRCFSPELANVLTSFASQPDGIVVKALNIEPEDLAAADTPGGTTGTPAAMAIHGGLPVVVDEKKLKVTMLIDFVKIIPGQGR